VTKDQAIALLVAYAYATLMRDGLVRQAHQAGVTKHRIHTITGIARTTIDRILAEERS